MNSRIPEPCDTPRGDHDGQVHFYVTGWKCDAHSPWAEKGLDKPETLAAGSGDPSLYTYRPAPAADDHL